jgi:tight adherence protein B
MTQSIWIFLGLVFAAVLLLSQGLMVPVFGEARATRKRLKLRLAEIEAHSGHQAIQSLLREKYLRELSPLERRLESLPHLETLAAYIEQAGLKTLAYRVVLSALALGGLGSWLAWNFTRMPAVAAGGAVVGLVAPFLRIFYARSRRLAQFEEQMPEAIDVMRRALKAGHPFSGSIKLVAEDMDPPLAREFELTFADINYGNDARRAMLGLLERVPSVSVMAFVTAVLVQKETGGNLADILDQISKVIRGRFKFYRKVKTLSAEGRMSAWILGLVPFVLFALISIIQPDYLPGLLDDPDGRKLLVYAGIASFVGILWIRRIIRIDV